MDYGIVAKVKKTLAEIRLCANIAAATDMPEKQVAAILEALTSEIRKSLGNKGAGVITIPGLVRIEKKTVPARPAQTGVSNPLTQMLLALIIVGVRYALRPPPKTDLR